MRMATLLIVCVMIAFAPLSGTPPLAANSGDTARIQAALGQSKVSPEARKSIDKGMQWLLTAMKRDGSVGPDIGLAPDIASTAIVGLALLSQGNTPQGGPNYITLRKLLDYMVRTVRALPNNDDPIRPETLVQRKIGRNADLFLAALFLGQVLGENTEREIDDNVRTALEKLVRIISKAQGKDGTWGEQSWAPILGTVLGWESLRTARSAGLKVEASAQAAGKALHGKLKVGPVNTGDWMQDFYKNASSIRVLYALNYREDAAFKTVVSRIIKTAQEDPRLFTQAGGEEYLAFFFVTECMLQEQKNAEWRKWYPTVRDKVIAVQNADGSWTGHHCIRDRTFCTACALLTLMAPDLHLPTSDL